jgi:HD-like signal output (HDOD) protein/FixJ family two-component response regulator
MSTEPLRALVVDDHEDILRLTVRAFVREGFQCVTAVNGRAAEERLDHEQFDVVITDFHMPEKDGHALVVGLLGSENRPVVVVVTGCLEPRLAKDLLVRGVDDVFFKPVDYGLLGAKVRILCDRRRQRVTGVSVGQLSQTGRANDCQRGTDVCDRIKLADGVLEINRVSLAEWETRLQQTTRLLPFSQTASEVFNLVRSDAQDIATVAATIGKDSVLTAELLRLANSAYFDSSSRKTADLTEAVNRIGYNRIGDIALATSALAALTPNLLPWLNVTVAWARSMGAGMAAEILLEQGKHSHLGRGAVLAAFMYPMGRAILGMLYPTEYALMVEHCGEQHKSLRDLEQKMFPESDSAAAAHVLRRWSVPDEVYRPLHYAAENFDSVSRLDESLRNQVELVKVSIGVAQLAVGRWSSWDLVEVPPADVLSRLRIASLDHVIEQIQKKLKGLAPAHYHGSRPGEPARNSKRIAISYCNLGTDSFDCFRYMLPSLDLTPIDGTSNNNSVGDRVLVNGLGVSPARVMARLAAPRADDQYLLVVDSSAPEELERFGRLVRLPTSYASLSHTCQQWAQALHALAGQH